MFNLLKTSFVLESPSLAGGFSPSKLAYREEQDEDSLGSGSSSSEEEDSDSDEDPFGSDVDWSPIDVTEQDLEPFPPLNISDPNDGIKTEYMTAEVEELSKMLLSLDHKDSNDAEDLLNQGQLLGDHGHSHDHSHCHGHSHSHGEDCNNDNSLNLFDFTLQDFDLDLKNDPDLDVAGFKW